MNLALSLSKISQLNDRHHQSGFVIPEVVGKQKTTKTKQLKAKVNEQKQHGSCYDKLRITEIVAHESKWEGTSRSPSLSRTIAPSW